MKIKRKHGKRSKEKGKEGELEVVHMLRAFGFKINRGQQFSGGGDSPDVVHSIPHLHIEVKRAEAFSLYDALKQANDDAKDEDVPVVFHRRNQKDWVVVMHAHDFLNIMEELGRDLK